MSKEQLPVDAWMPFFVGDWLTGEATVAMDPYQKGVFIDLLSWGWKHRGSLPTSVAVLAKLGGVTPDWFDTPEGRFVLDQFPVCDDGRRRNPKQAAVYSRAVARRQGKSDQAKRAADARWGRGRGGDDDAPGPAGSSPTDPPPSGPPDGAALGSITMTVRQAVNPIRRAALERWPTVVAWASTPARRELLEAIAARGSQVHGDRWLAFTFLPLVNFALQDGRKSEDVENGLRDWFGVDQQLVANRLRAFFAGATRNTRTVASIESAPARGTTRRPSTAENRPAGSSKFVDA